MKITAYCHVPKLSQPCSSITDTQSGKMCPTPENSQWMHPPPPRNPGSGTASESSSSAPPTGHYSHFSERRASQIYTRSTQQVETSHGGGHAEQPVEHGGVRDTGDNGPSGPASDGPRTGHTDDSQMGMNNNQLNRNSPNDGGGGGSGRGQQSQQQGALRGRRGRLSHRPVRSRNEPAGQGHPTETAMLNSPTLSCSQFSAQLRGGRYLRGPKPCAFHTVLLPVLSTTTRRAISARAQAVCVSHCPAVNPPTQQNAHRLAGRITPSEQGPVP